MISSIMEQKRLGVYNKAMMIVPNHLTGQTAIEYVRLDDKLKYICDREKTDDGFLVGTINGLVNNVVLAFDQMNNVKESFQKTDKILAHHFMRSFKPGEVTLEKAQVLGMKLAQRMFCERFQGFVTTHIDKGHIHNHIIINSVSHIDGYKFIANKTSLTYIRELSDEQCRENNLLIIEAKSKKERHKKETIDQYKTNQKKTWTEKIKSDINDVVENSSDFETYIKNMRKKGYKIKYGNNVKYISYRHENMEKFMHGKTLGTYYSEENIKDKIINKEKYKDVDLNEKQQIPKIEQMEKNNNNSKNKHTPPKEKNKKKI